MTTPNSAIVALIILAAWPIYGLSRAPSAQVTEGPSTSTKAPGTQNAELSLERSPLEVLLPYVGPDGTEKNLPVGPLAYDQKSTIRSIQEPAFQFRYNRPESLTLLDDTMHRYLKNRERDPSGLDKLTLLYARFDAFYFQDYQIRENAGFASAPIEKWRSLRPQSRFPQVVRAMMLMNRAFAASTGRPGVGSSMANTDDPNELLEQMVTELDKLGPTPGDAQPDILRIRARAMLGASDAELLKLIDEASRRNPSTLELYGMGALSVMSTTDDPAGYLETIARLAAERTPEEGKNAYYARTYWWVLTWIGIPNVRDFKVDWERFADGSREIVDRYPVQWNIQHLAAIACAGGAKDPARALINGAKGRPISSAWGQITYFQRCRDWTRN
ncbi:MAG: hypothetical protein R3D44_18445 [Hyphomicrobiaceae bacterium]